MEGDQQSYNKWYLGAASHLRPVAADSTADLQSSATTEPPKLARAGTLS